MTKTTNAFIILIFLLFWLPICAWQNHALVLGDACWFYDPNLGEQSFSEWLSLALLALATFFFYQAYKATKIIYHFFMIFLCILLFLEEANWGQVFVSSAPLIEDSLEWSLHSHPLIIHLSHEFYLSTLVPLALYLGLCHFSRKHSPSQQAWLIEITPPLLLLGFYLTLPLEPSTYLMESPGFYACTSSWEETTEGVLASCVLIHAIKAKFTSLVN